MKYISFVFAILTILIIVGVAKSNVFRQPDKCLMANEVDPESQTGSHLTVGIVEDAKDYYVTGWVWDHAVHEWTEMDYRVIDKKRAPEYVTLVDCPAPYKPVPYDVAE